jgi:RHS repeat-associated protein
LYLYDGWQCIEERELEDDAWEARRQYVFGSQYIDEPLIFDKDSEDGDGVCDDNRYFYCQQANYNVVAVTSDAGVIVDRINYDPYGEATLAVGGATGNPYLFQGRRWDSDTGLYYFRNRDYDPELGRFAQRDTLGYVDGMSLYQYASGNPVVRTDPMGGCAAAQVRQSGSKTPREVFVPPLIATGLNIPLTSSGKEGSCGEASYDVEFSLAGRTESRTYMDPYTNLPIVGYIIQRVDVETKFGKCDYHGGEKTVLVDKEYTFYEALGYGTGDIELGAVEDHFGFLEQGDCTYGWIHVKGEAKGAVDWRLTPDFVPWSFAESRQLPASGNAPSWWNKTPQGAKHEAVVWWDCCVDPPKHTKIYAKPRR